MEGQVQRRTSGGVDFMFKTEDEDAVTAQTSPYSPKGWVAMKTETKRGHG